MADYGKAFSSLYPTRPRDPRYDITVHSKVRGDTIPAILVVDSSRRNRDLYENPGHYAIQLPTTYTDVISVELMQANVPNSGYTVSTKTNKVTFDYTDEEVGGTYTATLSPGNYDPTALASELARALNAQFPLRAGSADADAKFAVSYSATSQKFTITVPKEYPNGDPINTGSFKLVAGVAGGADTVLGLQNGGTDEFTLSPAGGSVTLGNAVSLLANRYVVLKIQGMDRCDGNSSALMDAFCVIPLQCDDDFEIKTGDVIDNDVYIFHYPEPLPKLKKLEITFLAPDGTIYDFNGRDHFLVFQITCLSRPPKI